MYTQVNTEKAPSISNDDSTNYIIYRKKIIPILQITLGNSNPNLLCHVTNWCVTGYNKTPYTTLELSLQPKSATLPDPHEHIANTPSIY